MPREPKVSIILPVYNQTHLISNAINSILNQTIKDWELIIVDDGSEYSGFVNPLEKIVQQFNDKRIFLYTQNHQGIVAARNYGNSLARADIIAMQDADDLSLPDRLEKCLVEMKKAGADVLYHGIYVNMWQPNLTCIGRAYIPAEVFNRFRLLKEQYIPGACIFKKKCWEKKPFRKETEFAFDYMMHLDWAFSNFNYRALDIGLYEYVRQENSASITYEKDGRRKKSFDEIKNIMKKEYNVEIN